MKQITDEEYNELLHDQMLLTALYGAGVDDWEGWEVAKEILEEIKQENRESN